MKKVCLFGFPKMENFHDYYIESLDPIPYFRNNDKWNPGDLVWGGLNRFSKTRSLYFAEGLHRLYRENDGAYMRYARDFIDRYKDYDLVVIYTYCPLHPELLFHELKKPIKVLGFTDEPHSTYVRGVPYLWAFDGAYYISPSYDDRTYFQDALAQWGCSNSYWWPQVPGKSNYPELSDSFFSDRDIDLIYVGQQYGPKVDRLIKLKKHFGSRFRIYGRWALKGYGGMIRGFFGKPMLRSRVRSITNQERTRLYYRTKIGINMHLSERPMETGNMRMYEIPAHGMMQLCDKAGLNTHEKIFQPGREAVFYDSIDDAVEKIEHFLSHDEERIEIARAGLARVQRDYDWERNLLRFLDWASGLTRRAEADSLLASHGSA